LLPYIVLDIETGFADKATVARAVERIKPPSNYKDPEKISKWMEDAATQAAEDSALLDGSPVTCISLVCGKARHVFDSSVKDGEATMLNQVRHFLDTETGPDTVVVGHNHLAFDLPRLRSAYLRNRLALPMIFRVDLDETKRPKVADTMRMFHYFTSERHEDRHVSLRDVVAALGLPPLKDGVTGKDMPALAKAGKWGTVREYCLLDAVATEAAYLLMTCQHASLK